MGVKNLFRLAVLRGGMLPQQAVESTLDKPVVGLVGRYGLETLRCPLERGGFGGALRVRSEKSRGKGGVLFALTPPTERPPLRRSSLRT